ncbi:cupredoxin domain-containing protein [Lysobacter terrae]
MSRRIRFGVVALVAAVVLAAAWAALAPVPVPASREQAFVIPKGTWQRRMAGERIEILPQQIRLTLGINDVLLLQNHDTVPQTFGPALLMPGQNFRLPFELASEYQFACSAHASGQMTIVVDPYPDSAWGRLRWRTRRLLDAITTRTHPTTHQATQAQPST